MSPDVPAAAEAIENEGKAGDGFARAAQSQFLTGRGSADLQGALGGMASPQQPHGPSESSGSPPMRVRVAVWDVVSTVAIWTVLFVVAMKTSWPSRLFGFVAHVCTGDSCPPVPFGIDLWIYPVVWGGIGAAGAAAVIGPLVSLVKGWYMFFWPILAVAIVVLSAVAGAIMTAFSEHYWH